MPLATPLWMSSFTGCMWWEWWGWPSNAKGPDRGIWSCCINLFYNNVYVHQLSYHFVWTENGKLEVKAINKWIGKHMNGEMTPYERDSGELEWWELFFYPRCSTVKARCIARPTQTNSAERGVQLPLDTLHCLTCNDSGLLQLRTLLSLSLKAAL